MYLQLIQELNSLKNTKQALLDQRFFKTGKGEYGEGDIFWGIQGPQIKILVKKYKDLKIEDIAKLVSSEIHEARFIGFAIIRNRFEREKTEEGRKALYDFSIENRRYLNNWDLVDIFTPHVFGRYLFNKDKKILYEYALSKDLWERRISMISSMYFVKNGEFEDAIKLAEMFLDDKEDLIHKASGWVLREVGKKDKNELVKFLDKNIKKMPRTMLRYSIEKFPEEERKYYLSK